MRPQEKSVSSNDAGDNLPLRYAYSNESPTKNSLEDLLRHNIQTCEFCEARCENKFDMLIHNSTHIIIPLIKEATHRCRECDMLCISEEHLSHHMSMRHAISPPKTVMNGIKLSEKIMFDNEEFEMNDQFENETLDRLIREEQQDNGHILQNLVMNCKVDVQKFDTPWLDNQKVIPNGVSTAKRKSVKNEPSSDISILDDPIVLVTPMALTKNEHKSEYESDSKSYFESIHYYELMKPGIYYCKHCHKRFPNRYDVIIHEIVHMDLSKVISVKRKEQRPNSPDGRVKSPQQFKYVKDISVKRKEQRPNSPDARVKSTQQVKYSKDISVKKKERRHSIHDSLMSLNRKERRHSNQDLLMKSPRKVKNAIHITTCQYCQAQVVDPTEHEKNCLKFICFCGKRYARKFWLEKHQMKEGHDFSTRPDSTPDLKLDLKPARIADRIHFEEHEQFSIKKHDQEEKNKKEYEEEERNKKKTKPLTKMDRLKMIQTRIKLINKQGYAAQYAQASHKKKFLRIEKQQDR